MTFLVVKSEMLFVKFDVFTAVTMKNSVLEDIMPDGYIKNRGFGGTCRLHQQGAKNQRARNKVNIN
jgi:hypothetical protein